MRYVSTRGAAPALSFAEVLLAGLAPDGGLYVPQSAPLVQPAASAEPYAALASRIMSPFVGDAVPGDVFGTLIGNAYGTFSQAAVAPLRQIDERLWLLELFHGPTLAFKDVALQLLGQLFTHFLSQTGRRVTIVGATSGDTGSAAIQAFRGSPHADIFILLPKGRVSEVQRRQMTTVDEANVHVIAIEGSFDDCQDLVKALFADADFRDRIALSAVNSINWARIMAQIVYYFAATTSLGGTAGRKIAFCVPSGNFGNAYAGHMARRMGAAIQSIIVASNANDVLTRTIETGEIALETVVPTLSPAMDIQVSSNFERLMFELYAGDGEELAAGMKTLRARGRLHLSPERHAVLRGSFTAARVNDEETLLTIADTWRRFGIMIDPHTAIAVRAARAATLPPDVPVVALATAHPAKFPEAVVQATGITPELPPNLADLMHRHERYNNLPNDEAALRTFILERVRS